jgi:hypothetical protein
MQVVVKAIDQNTTPMNTVEIIIPVTFFATVFGVSYLYLNARHRERMAMIERGMEESLLLGKKEDQLPQQHKILKRGLLAIGIGGGVATGCALNGIFDMELGAAIFSMVLLGGGLSLLAFYKKMRDFERDEEEDEYNF